MFAFTEASYENSIVELFENMGYTHIYGPDIERTEQQYHDPLMADELRSSLERINSSLPSAAIVSRLLLWSLNRLKQIPFPLKTPTCRYETI